MNIHKAKTNLSKLVDAASKGEPFIIAKAGKPMVKVTAIEQPLAEGTERLGWMAGQFKTPENFDRWGEDEILEMFGVRE